MTPASETLKNCSAVASPIHISLSPPLTSQLFFPQTRDAPAIISPSLCGTGGKARFSSFWHPPPPRSVVRWHQLMQQNSFPGDADDLHRCKDEIVESRGFCAESCILVYMSFVGGVALSRFFNLPHPPFSRVSNGNVCRMRAKMQELMQQNNEARGTMVSLKDQRYTYARRIPHSLFGLQTSKQAKLNTDVVLECRAERRQRFMVQKFEEKNQTLSSETLHKLCFSNLAGP